MTNLTRFAALFFAICLTFKGTASSPTVETILLVDNSGSMKTSDPTGLRFTAVEMVAALLDGQDQMGVITFSSGSHELTNGLISPDSFTGISPIPPQGYTDIKSALTEASRMLLSQANSQSRRAIILLSDGRPEIEHPYPAYEQETLALAHTLGVPIYAIALTNLADQTFLRELVAQTGGKVIPAQNAEDLLDAYLVAFNDIQDRTLLSPGETTSPGKVTFEIDPALAPYLEKVSFVLAKPETVTARLLAPGGQVVSENSPDIHIVENPYFSIVTIQHPAGGDWAFEIFGQGKTQARAILYSHLRAEIVSPEKVQPAGRPIPIVVRLVDEESAEKVNILGDAAFSATIIRPDGTESSLDRFYDDGTHGDKVAGDGNFTRLFVDTSQLGQYQIHVTGWKGVISVEQSITMDVAEFPTLILDKPHGEVESQGKQVTVQVHLYGDAPLAIEQGEVLAQITTPSGQTQEITLSSVRDGYVGGFSPTENGKYSVSVETQGMTYFGVPFQTTAQGLFNVHIVRNIELEKPNVQVPLGCFDDAGGISITLPVTSTQPELITFSLSNLPGFVLRPVSMNIQPGAQMIKLEILSSSGGLSSGIYRTNLQVSGDPQVSIAPKVIPLEIDIPSFWSKCRQPIVWSGLTLVFMVLVGVVTVRYIRNASAPPQVTGTLRWWAAQMLPANAKDVDLTALKKSSLTIGEKSNCDLVFVAERLNDVHAVLTAERKTFGMTTYLEPLGPVKKGYQMMQRRFLLKHGEIFSMGSLNFQYLSDSGE